MRSTSVMYDSLVREISRDIVRHWKEDFSKLQERLKVNPHKEFASTWSEEYQFRKAPKKGDKPLEFDVEATLIFKHTEEWEYKVDGNADEGCKRGRDKGQGCIFVDFTVDPRSLPSTWEDITYDIKDVVRHEIEHLLQGGWSVKRGKEKPNDDLLRVLIQNKLLPAKSYFELEKEVDAQMYGMYLKAKKKRVPFPIVIKDYLNLQPITQDDQSSIINLWSQRARKLSLPSPA